MSIALARKYRPKRFADVAVQSHVSSTLKGAIARGRVAHGYLLCGPRGTGKTTLARVLAMALNCERRVDAARRLEELEKGKAAGGVANGDADLNKARLMSEASEPCGECASCRRIWSGAASLDVVEIDAASNRGVDDARELRERAMYAPSAEQGYKVYIVDEAHMLTREAWNALLKILEEPPPRVVFVFATTEPQKIMQAAAPVLSRVQRFDLKRIGPGEIRERLSHVLTSEGVGAEPEALAAIARAADGSMRDALSLTDQVLSMGEGDVTADRVREALGLVAEDEFIAILDLVAERRAADVFPAVSRLAEAGIDFGGFLTGLADMLRAQLAIVLGGQPPDVSERAREALDSRKDRFAAADLLRMLQAIGELEPRFRKSGQQQLLIETLLVRFALLDRSVDLEDVLRSLGGGGRGGGGGGGSATTGGAGAGNVGARSAAPAMRAEPRAEPRSESRPIPRATSAAAPAIVATPSREPTQASGASLDLSQVVGRWDALVERVREAGKPMLASALEHASPVAVTANGLVTIELDEANDIFAHSITSARTELAGILREWFAGVDRVELRRDESAPAAPPKRLTDEDLRAQRIAALRKRDPVLSAAIDALDLDVAD
ncbi:MAG TPA: DNA polymerase III subunit gamma/tau [Gemmatimonadaceae bacterium]|nr:DNA polymerase III subunit gamma/tau [Gemmatimonadaceae bacterium]